MEETEKKVNYEPVSLQEDVRTDHLDGGYGWIIVMASFFMQACSFGVIAGFGIFLNYYKKDIFPNHPFSHIALIGTVAPATLAIASIVTGRLCDKLGFRKCTLIGWGLIVTGFITASFSTEIWHFIITQGFLFGLGGAFLYVTANTVVSQWFLKHRGLAMGIGTAGTGIGGLVSSVINTRMLSDLSLPWVLRINGLVVGSILFTSALIIKSPKKISLIPADSSPKSESFKFSSILTLKFLLFFFTQMFGNFGYLTPLYYLPSYAESVGLSKYHGAFLVGTVNISSAIGRIILGFLGDRIGHARIFFLCLLCSTLLPIIWLFNDSFTVLMVFAVMYGASSGGFAGGFPATCAALFGEKHLATIMGIAYSPSCLGDLFGAYLAGSILDTSQNYRYIIYYTMSLYGTATLIMLAILIITTKQGLTKTPPAYST